MKIRYCLLPALLFTLGVTLSSAQTVLMDEQFNYTLGDLSSPWTVSSATSGSTVTVETATAYNGYTPTGNQITIYRPTGGTAPTETLLSGAQVGTSALNLSVGTHLIMTLEMSYPTLSNNQGFVFSLRSGTTTFAGMRLYNTTAGGGTTLQYMTTNSSASFTNVASTALSDAAWYKVTLDVTIDSLTQSTMNLSLEQLGTGGGTLITANNLILTSATNFNTTTAISFYSGISGGNITYSLANLNLDTVPEPSQLSLLVFAAPLFLLFYRRTRFHVSR